MTGWIKLSRDISKHWIWQDSQRLKWWLDLLLMASYKKRKKFLKKEGRFIELQPGETDASYGFLADRWGVDKRIVRRFIELLEADGMVYHQAHHSYAIITICNYDKYQDVASEECTSERTPGGITDSTSDSTPDSTPERTQEKNIISKESKEYFVVGLLTREAFFEDFFKGENSASLEAFCMTTHTDLATMKRLATEVLDEWQLTEEKPHQDLNAAKRHLLNQIRIKLAVERREKQADERRLAEARPKTNRTSDKGPRSVNGRWEIFNTQPPTE